MKNRNWVDLTYTINEQTRNFRNNLGCKFETIWDYHNCTSETKFKVQKISINAGFGTHIDSPMHIFKNGLCVSEMDLFPEVEGLILDFEDLCMSKKIFTITKNNLEEKLKIFGSEKIENKFIVFKTGWGKFWGTDQYHNDYSCPHIDAECAKFLEEEKIFGIGIDTFSPDDCKNEKGKYPVHEILLAKNICIIENIANLENLKDEIGLFSISPLKIETSEAPVRVFFKKI